MSFAIRLCYKILDGQLYKDHPRQFAFKALELWLRFINSAFSIANYIKTDGLAQGLHILCWYSDIAMTGNVSKDLVLDFPPEMWKRFRDEFFAVCTHDIANLPSFLDYLNNIDFMEKLNLPCKLQVKKMD